MLSWQHLHQLFNRRSRRAIASVPTDAERLFRCGLGNAGDILIKDIEMFRGACSRNSVTRGGHGTQFLDICAEKRATLQHHLEAVIIGWIVAAGYFNAAIDIIQYSLGII